MDGCMEVVEMLNGNSSDAGCITRMHAFNVFYADNLVFLSLFTEHYVMAILNFTVYLLFESADI